MTKAENNLTKAISALATLKLNSTATTLQLANATAKVDSMNATYIADKENYTALGANITLDEAHIASDVKAVGGSYGYMYWLFVFGLLSWSVYTLKDVGKKYKDMPIQ